MEKLKQFWGTLPKTAKVFVYLAVSTLLSEWLIELRAMEPTMWVRYLVQIINLLIVLLQESVPAVAARFRK